MKRFPNLLLLCLLLFAVLVACQDAISTPNPTPVPIPQATETVITQKFPTQTFMPSQEPTAEPMSTQRPEDEEATALDCADQFCQILWRGHLERPFGEAYRREIDLIYPYASTKDGNLEPHHGVEFPNPFGTPVLAAASGEVIYAGSDAKTLLGPYLNFYGNVVIMKHPGLFFGQDIYTLYAHLSSIQVLVGEVLAAGQMLGEVGASGAADGSHLHFEVRMGSNDYARTVNPTLWFSPIQPTGSQAAASLAGVIMDRYGQPRSEVDFVLERFDDQNKVANRYYLKTYYAYGANSHPTFGENFSIADIPAGQYRLSYVFGTLYEEYFTLEPGSVGFITLREE